MAKKKAIYDQRIFLKLEKKFIKISLSITSGSQTTLGCWLKLLNDDCCRTASLLEIIFTSYFKNICLHISQSLTDCLTDNFKIEFFHLNKHSIVWEDPKWLIWIFYFRKLYSPPMFDGRMAPAARIQRFTDSKMRQRQIRRQVKQAKILCSKFLCQVYHQTLWSDTQIYIT